MGYAYPQAIVTVRQGVTYPPFSFHEGGLRELIATITNYARLTKSPTDPTLLLVNDLVRVVSHSYYFKPTPG